MSLDESVRIVVREEMHRVFREELPRLLAELRPATNPGDGYLSVQKAAALAEVCPDTIRGWVKSGRLPEHRAGRELRILRADLCRFLAGGGNDRRATALEEASTILARRRSE